MLAKECMTDDVELANPEMSLREAAQKMKDGDFGGLPVRENDRLVGMITDRDITIRAVADGKDPNSTQVREVMSNDILYCFEDDDIEEVNQNMAGNQIRRLPVLNREKRLVGIVALGDLAMSKDRPKQVGETLGQIST